MPKSPTNTLAAKVSLAIAEKNLLHAEYLRQDGEVTRYAGHVLGLEMVIDEAEEVARDKAVDRFFGRSK